MKNKKLIISIVAVCMVIVISVLAVIGIRNNEPKTEKNSTTTSTTASTTESTTEESTTESTTKESTVTTTETITKETTTSKKEEKTTAKTPKPVTTTKKQETTTKVNITYPEVVYSNPFVDFIYGSYVRDIWIHTSLVEYSFGSYDKYDDKLEMFLVFRIDKIYLHIDETDEKIAISVIDHEEIPKYDIFDFYLGDGWTYDRDGRKLEEFGGPSVDVSDNIRGKSVNETFTVKYYIYHASEVAKIHLESRYDENWKWID